MITIIHGDDIQTSRNFFYERRNNSQNPITLNGATVKTPDLAQILAGGMLFAADKNIFIEDLLTRKKAKSKDLDSIVEYLNENHEFAQITLWEGKELTKTQINLFKKADIKQFKLPQVIFTFLDNVFAKKPEQRVKLFHQALQNSEPEMIFALLIRQFRLLLAISSQSTEQIDEAKRLSPWQANKLHAVLRSLSIDQLKLLYKRLYEIDYNQKTGGTPLSLEQSIDFFLLQI